MIMGDIPDAPGLEDLDKLYPEDVDEIRAKRDDEEVVEVSAAMPLPAPLPPPQSNQHRRKNEEIEIPSATDIVGNHRWRCLLLPVVKADQRVVFEPPSQLRRAR